MFDTWKNKPDSFEVNDDVVIINAPGKTDYFNDPASDARKRDAAFLSREVSGDFTLEGRVTPEFAGTYDAGTLTLYSSDEIWAKLAFENTDMGCTSVVSVVTRDRSDDANGEVVTDPSIYLKMTRRGETVGFYYSLDRASWRMVRLFTLPAPSSGTWLVGVTAQSPRGSGCRVTFSDLSFVPHAVSDIRRGV